MFSSSESLIFLPDMIYFTGFFFLKKEPPQNPNKLRNIQLLAQNSWTFAPFSVFHFPLRSVWLEPRAVPFLSWPFPAGKGRERLCMAWERNNTCSSLSNLYECFATVYVTNIFKTPELWKVSLEKTCLHMAPVILWNYGLLLWYYNSFTLLSADMIKPYYMELGVRQLAFVLYRATDRSSYVLFLLG